MMRHALSFSALLVVFLGYCAGPASAQKPTAPPSEARYDVVVEKDVRVPVRIVHGTRDDVVDVQLSRDWSAGRRHVRLVEVDDGHELVASVPRVLAEADEFFRPFFGE